MDVVRLSPVAHFPAILGLDPGSKGVAVVLSLLSNQARIWSVKASKHEGVPVVSLNHFRLAMASPPVCFVERLDPDSRFGKTSFALGAYAGAAVSILLSFGWEVRTVRPQTWQAFVHAKGEKVKGEAKARSLDAYYRLFPHDPLPKIKSTRYPQGRHDDNAIDALLIAAYGAASLGVKLRPWVFPKGVRW